MTLIPRKPLHEMQPGEEFEMRQGVLLSCRSCEGCGDRFHTTGPHALCIKCVARAHKLIQGTPPDPHGRIQSPP